VQEKKVRVLEFIPLNLLNKVEEIAITSLLVMYNTNPMPHAICALSSPTNVKQQRLGAEEELQE
jgi:hypothetical protein